MVDITEISQAPKLQATQSSSQEASVPPTKSETEILQELNASLKNGDMTNVLLICRDNSLDRLGHLFTQSILRNRKEDLKDDLLPLNSVFEERIGYVEKNQILKNQILN